MSLRLSALLVLLVGLLSLGGASPSVAISYLTITTMARTPANCRPETARKTTVSAFRDLPFHIAPECVRVRGLLVDGLLFASLDDYHRAGGTNSPLGDVWGLIADDHPHLLKASSPKAAWVELTGIVAHCTASYHPWPGPRGRYCEETTGRVLIVKDARKGKSFTLERPASEADRAGFAALLDLRDDNPEASEVRDLASRWVAALQGGDLARFLAIARLGATHTGPQETLFTTPEWRSVRDPSRALPLRIFGENYPQSAYPSWTYYACVCREADCTGRWPITSWDAGLNPRHPYVCTEIKRGYPDRNIWSLWMSEDSRTLREPARPGA